MVRAKSIRTVAERTHKINGLREFKKIEKWCQKIKKELEFQIQDLEYKMNLRIWIKNI